MAFLPIVVSAQEGKATLGVGAMKPTPSLIAAVEKSGKKTEMGRVVESLDSQLIDRINATRKFEIVANSDLKDILQAQDKDGSGLVDPKTAAQAGKLAGTKYLLMNTVDDFQDYVETAKFEGTGRSSTKRVFRLSCVGKIYDATTGKLLESANFQIGPEAFKDIRDERSYSTKDGNLTDEMMVGIARNMAEKIATHVADVIFPAKVLIKRDKLVTINRGEGGGLSTGELLNVFAVGEELIDPDTKESLGREEVKVGKVKVTQITAKTSQAEILEDTGIDKGAILRKPQ